MTPPASLLDDLRAIERHAAAGGADDKLLARAIPLHVLLLMGLRPDAACAYLHARALIASGIPVKIACERSKLSRRRYYQLREMCRFLRTRRASLAATHLEDSWHAP